MKRRPKVGRDAITLKARAALNLPSTKEADQIVNVVTEAVVCVLAENITTDGFSLRFPRFGIFSVVHKPSRERKIPLTGNVQMVEAKRKIKFRPLSELRELEHSPEPTGR